MFTIDGTQWPYPCQIIRTSELKASDISGMLMDKTWFNDVLGQYLSYEIAIAVPIGDEDRYAQLYETITDPVEGHTMVLPYNGAKVEIMGRVESIRDEGIRMPGGYIHWTGIRFTFIASHPTRTYSLNDVITRGRSILPEATNPVEGDIYQYHNGAWGPVTYADADSISY